MTKNLSAAKVFGPKRDVVNRDGENSIRGINNLWFSASDIGIIRSWMAR